MKKIIVIIFILMLTSGVILWVKGKDMREIQTEIEIAASPEKVWSILMDFDNWTNWNPIVHNATGSAVLGSEISMTMIGKNEKKGPKYAPVVTELEQPKYFRWRAKMIAEFLFTNDKIFEIQETSSGTRLIHKELFQGMLVPLFWGKCQTGVRPMLESMNEALKQRVENIP